MKGQTPIADYSIVTKDNVTAREELGLIRMAGQGLILPEGHERMSPRQIRTWRRMMKRRHDKHQCRAINLSRDLLTK